MHDIEEMDMGWFIKLINHQEEKELRDKASALDDAGL